jgi:hypothetical protein
LKGIRLLFGDNATDGFWPNRDICMSIPPTLCVAQAQINHP